MLEYNNLCLCQYILSRVGGTRDGITGSSSDDWIYWHFGHSLS
jgi:hypothetical protein